MIEDGKLKTGLVTAHDAINKVIICYLLGLEAANFWNIKQGNGAVTVIDYPKGLDGLPILQALFSNDFVFWMPERRVTYCA